MENKQDDQLTTEDYLADISEKLSRIAHAIEFLAKRSSESFMTEAHQKAEELRNVATRATG
jgi:hypothetical protein